MPRNNVDPSKLKNAWIALNNTDNIPLDEKINASKRIIQKALNSCTHPTISWSGGKDSTVLLHMVRHFLPDIPTIFVDLDCLFPETKVYINELRTKWNLNLHTTRSEEYDFKSLTKKYGYPIFGKNIANNVERARRTNNLRKQLSPFEVFLVKIQANISSKCSQFLLERPCKIKEHEFRSDLKFIGLRALESRARVRLWADYGDIYVVKDYYGKAKPITKCNPISMWSEKDIWDYFERFKIPRCKIYEMGYHRNGCWTCAMAIRNGQLKRLNNYNPELYYDLIYKSEMGEEIRRIKTLLEKESKYKKYIKLD
jgi:3'-phosphoadenosine 5'-phosphosulfate sulfotransferase (PAPS reductase)/FAD synthetase